MNFWNDPVQMTANWLLDVFTGWGFPGVLSNILISLNRGRTRILAVLTPEYDGEQDEDEMDDHPSNTETEE